VSRPSGSYPVVNRRITGAIMLIAAVVLIGIGTTIAGVEVYHLFENWHPVIWQNLAASLGFIGAGASLAQTLSVRETLSMMRAAVPLFQSQQVGGQRSTDPKSTDDDDDAPKLPTLR